MILTVTPNPALDLTWHVDRLTVGGTHRADTGASRAGGKGINVARVAHSQGYAVRALTTAGGASGTEFADELAESGVPHRLVPVSAPTRRSVAWVDRALGDTTIVNEYGHAPSDDEWAALTATVREEIGGSRVLVISGSLPPGTPTGVLPDLIAAGRSAGIDVIVDTSGQALLDAVDAGTSIVKPNRAEILAATGEDDPLRAAVLLQRRGAELVLLSAGSDGMWAVTATELVHARLADPLAGNPTGAGDAAVAAVATLLDDGVRDPERLLRRATAWSAAAVLMPLAGDISPTHPQLEDALIVEHHSLPKDLR